MLGMIPGLSEGRSCVSLSSPPQGQTTGSGAAPMTHPTESPCTQESTLDQESAPCLPPVSCNPGQAPLADESRSRICQMGHHQTSACSVGHSRLRSGQVEGVWLSLRPGYI